MVTIAVMCAPLKKIASDRSARVHPTVLPSQIISSRPPPPSNRPSGPMSQPRARRECHRSPLSRVCLGWRVEATRPPDLSNNRNVPDRLWPSDGRLTPGLCTRRVDTSRLRSPWLQPSLGHGAFNNVPLNPSAMRAGKEAEVLARPARLNRRQLHW
jgi:hypothetical protein